MRGCKSKKRYTMDDFRSKTHGYLIMEKFTYCRCKNAAFSCQLFLLKTKVNVEEQWLPVKVVCSVRNGLKIMPLIMMMMRTAMISRRLAKESEDCV